MYYFCSQRSIYRFVFPYTLEYTRIVYNNKKSKGLKKCCYFVCSFLNSSEEIFLIYLLLHSSCINRLSHESNIRLFFFLELVNPTFKQISELNWFVENVITNDWCQASWKCIHLFWFFFVLHTYKSVRKWMIIHPIIKYVWFACDDFEENKKMKHYH